jgi:hypothetical protein
VVFPLARLGQGMDAVETKPTPSRIVTWREIINISSSFKLQGPRGQIREIRTERSGRRASTRDCRSVLEVLRKIKFIPLTKE